MPSKKNKGKSTSAKKVVAANPKVSQPVSNSKSSLKKDASKSVGRKSVTPPVSDKKAQANKRKSDPKKIETQKPLEDIKLELPNPEINQLPKPKFRRVRFWENGIEMYLQESRKVTIFQQKDGTFTIETKKSLGKDDDFSSFMPVDIDLNEKWGMRVATCRFTLSREAILAIGMGLNEMVKSQVIK